MTPGQGPWNLCFLPHRALCPSLRTSQGRSPFPALPCASAASGHGSPAHHYEGRGSHSPNWQGCHCHRYTAPGRLPWRELVFLAVPEEPLGNGPQAGAGGLSSALSESAQRTRSPGHKDSAPACQLTMLLFQPGHHTTLQSRPRLPPTPPRPPSGGPSPPALVPSILQFPCVTLALPQPCVPP